MNEQGKKGAKSDYVKKSNRENMSLKPSRTLCSVTKVAFVHAGCGVNALSGLQMLPKFNILVFL
ncbi:hypothetical protein DWG95_20095 [Escherichia coli]|jgi:hypothetical protein|nr:hypothetical protein [Escherichia coli]EFA4952941.1 hypothetical protein [Escherichia coli]EFN9754312.1 hypothetical protein [Escherichia coli]EFO1362951.1 hypothetical protein [Escherichia coli]EFO1475538.1 hypothetical protein [Escherichia coli]